MARKSRKSKKSQIPKSQRQPITASTVLSLLETHADGLVWRELLNRLDARGGPQRQQLRLMLRGLLRNEQITEDRQGVYRTSGGPTIEGILHSRGGQLWLAEHVLDKAPRSHLRAGDRVRAIVANDSARVLETLEYSADLVVGELRSKGRHPYVEALGPAYKGRITLTETPAAGGDGDSVAVRIVGEDRRGLVGTVQALVAQTGGAAQAADTLLASHGVPLEWPEAVPAATVKLPDHVVAGRHLGKNKSRRDLRNVPLVTIDGETARDFDDAVFAERQGKGWRLLVAIADVAHYVKPGGALDKCAWERGNSVYLPDRVIPMLPEVLSNGLCSLRPLEVRLAMVCEMRISAGGRVTRFEFYEAVIRSWERLTYHQVAQFLDSGELAAEADVRKSLLALHDVYGAFRNARDTRGGLDFDSHEANIVLEDDRVVGIQPVHRNDAHRLIEEAMIAANVCAAQFLEQHNRLGMYRVHEPPSHEKAEQMRQAFAFAGIRARKGDISPTDVQAALQQLASRSNAWVFESLILRSMTQATYTPENKGHFGLALKRYMHFTSPIRRYADLIVHRAIKLALHEKHSEVGSMDTLLATGEHISLTERRAEEVGWGVDAWLKCEFMADRIGHVFEGVVAGVTEFGLFVELEDCYVQGLLHISEIGKDYFHFQAETMSLVGERSNRRFTLGDHLSVQLMDVNPPRGRMDLVMADKGRNKNPKTNNKKGRSKGGNRGRRR